MKTLIAIALLPLAAACANPNPMHARNVTTRTVTRTVTQVTPGNAANIRMTGLEVAPEIAKVCKLPTTHFDFDSSAIKDASADALDKLANCFTKGELAGKTMRIIGHADPRGTKEYNLGLGQRRADSVAAYLKQHGLTEDRIETSSLGSFEAKGKNEVGWAKDRKVEILLGKDAVLLPKPAGGGV